MNSRIATVKKKLNDSAPYLIAGVGHIAVISAVYYYGMAKGKTTHELYLISKNDKDQFERTLVS